MAMEGWMEGYDSHCIQREATGKGNVTGPSTGDFRPEDRRINLIWRWMVPATSPEDGPTGPNEDPTPTGVDYRSMQD